MCSTGAPGMLWAKSLRWPKVGTESCWEGRHSTKEEHSINYYLVLIVSAYLDEFYCFQCPHVVSLSRLAL